MSSSGVCSSSYKSAEISECAKGKPNHQKAVTRRKECKNNEHFNQELERRNNNDAFDDSSTRVFVFKEVSSLDEDDSCNLGRRNSWSSKIGLVKKIKLSEDGTALISESFENFCEIHKNVRKNDDRPYSSDGHKVPKPHIQPTAERGIKKQQRPTTAGKLSEIAVNKYPDSIFKVYIPEGNRVIKKKRVVPLIDMKPVTPVRTRPNSRDVHENAHTRNEKMPNSRTVGPPLKTRHSIPHQALQNSDKRQYKAAGENPEALVSKSLASGQTPKKMTHITDISLTKEQEKKRMIEREVMRKRTMDVVKMAFPATGSDETKPNEHGGRGYDSEISGDECSRQNKNPSKSKSSLKSYSSLTSYGLPVTGKRSVTWGENEWSDSPTQTHGNNKPCPRRKKKMVHRISSSSSIGRIDIKCSSGAKLNCGSRSYGKSHKGPMANSFKREKKKYTRARTQNDSHKPFNNNERKPIKKKDTYTRRTSLVDDSYSDSDRKDESDSEDCCSRERFQIKKHVKDKKPFKRCDCGRVIDKNKIESKNEIESEVSGLNIEESNEIKDEQCANQKYNCIEGEDSFHNRRSAIIRKHSTKDTFTNSRKNDFEKYSNIEKESDPDQTTSYCNEEEMLYMKRGKSTPSLRKISTMDISYGSSDSELCFRKDSNKQHSDKSAIKFSSDEKSEEKPLRRIFDSSNSQNEVSKNELVAIMPSEEKINRSKSFSGSKIDRSRSFSGSKINGNVRELEENVVAETFSEGFKMSRLNMKPDDNVEELCSMGEAQLKYFTEEDNIKENLMKEDCILNLKPILETVKQEIRGVQSLNIKTSRCNSLMLPRHLSHEYVVDAYNVVTGSSKSLKREHNNTMPLVREVPMLNLSYDDKSVKRDILEETKEKLELPKKAPKSATEISNESNISAQPSLTPENSNVHDSKTEQSLSQQEHLQNDYSQSFKVKTNIQEFEKTRKTPLRSQRLASNDVPDSKNSNSVVISHSKLKPPEEQKSAQNQQPKPILPRNLTDKNNGISEKNPSPQSPNLADERKLHLQKMLSKRGESVGTSRMASQIKEKWNFTQKSICQRKEKMLASLRDTRQVETERTPNLKSKSTVKRSSPLEDTKNTQLPTQQVNVQVIQDVEDRLSIEEIATFSDVAADPPCYETQPTEQCELDNEEDETSFFEKEDFETTIVMPGSRIPQPYSSTNILDPSDRHLDESLSPYTNEDTPEKPLCESPDSGIISSPIENNLTSGMEKKQSCAPIMISDLDEEIPERDLTSPLPMDLVRADKTSLEVYINARSSISDVDSTYGSTRSNASNHETSICSRIKNRSIEAVHSDENDVTTQAVIPSISRTRNVQEAILSKKRNVLPKSASYSRPASRRSKASSSGSSRRSVEPIGRPPSRKPHMLGSSDEDSDQEIITISSPYHVECYNRNVKEPLKKAPTSRMYSTLNHAPHPGQESIKTVIKDLDSVKEDARSSSVCTERPMSSGQNSSRGGGYQSCSSRPSTGKSNMPKMSPGSVKILKEKSKNVSQRSSSPNKINERENRATKPSPRTQKTKQQDSQKNPCSKQIQGNSGNTRKGSPEKPRFRCFTRSNPEDEDIWKLHKLRNITVNKPIENYLPPWERVDLTPPESALKDRASNERRLGITSRVTARASSPHNIEIQASRYQGNSGTSTPRGVSTIGGGRTPVRGRTPVGCKTPASPNTPVGGRTPVGDRNPANCRTPVNCRTPIGNLSPVVGSRTPIRNRTPNPPERKPVEQRMVAEKNSNPRTDEKPHQE